MPQRILAVTTLLVLFVACRDGPVELTVPVEARMVPQADVMASVNALQTVTEMLNDPFVRELVRGAGSHTELLYSAVRDVSAYRMEEQVEKLSQVLTATKRALFASAEDAEEDPDGEIVRAALALVLDDAATLLEQSVPGAEREKRVRDMAQH